MSMEIVPEAGRMGEIYGQLFENAEAGIERDIYWSITCACVPIQYGGEEWPTSITCEWLAWSLSDWTGLNGASYESVKRPDLVECSFYLSEHHPVALQALTLRAISATDPFAVSVRGEVNIEGFDELARTYAFAAEYEVQFQGLVVVPANLYPEPRSGQEATATLAPFIKLANFQEPEWDRFRYVFPLRSQEK